MTDVARLWRRTPRPGRGLRSPWVLPVVAALAVSSTAVIAAPPSGASIQSDRTRAAQLYARIQTVSGKVAYLGQQFDLAQLKVQAEEDIIVHTKEIVAQDAADVHTDQTQLRNVAMVAYVNAGETSGQNSLFSTNQATAGATSVYSNLAEGNLTEAVTALRSSSIELVDQRHILRHQVRIRQDAARAAQAELESAQSLRSELSSMEHSVNAQIQAYVAAAAAAATAQNEANWARTHPGNNYTGAYSNFPVPPPNSRANIAVRTALSYLGVPYVWGGASRSGVDCSGLVMLAWEAAGVDLPHYSGAQYADTVHIPLGDIQPGDLLFYGPGGDEHVAMYIGRGLMIEAPETGEVVHITPIRTGYGFAGVGRVE